MTKRCNTCLTTLPATAFSVRQDSRDGLQPRCKSCWRLDYTAQLADHLREHPCVDCGESDIRCLDFDHRDPTDKVMGVTQLIALHATWARVAAEIAKCDVRCASCHRKRTAVVMNDWRNRQWHVEEAATSAAAASRLRALLA